MLVAVKTFTAIDADGSTYNVTRGKTHVTESDSLATMYPDAWAPARDRGSQARSAPVTRGGGTVEVVAPSTPRRSSATKPGTMRHSLDAKRRDMRRVMRERERSAKPPSAKPGHLGEPRSSR